MLFLSENTIFIEFSEKQSSCNTNTVCKQKTEDDEKKWVVFEHGKRVFFCLFLFQALMSLCFLPGKVARVLKMLVLLPFFALCGVAYSCLFGFGRFRCFCVSCLCFSFCCWFCFYLFALFCLWLDVVVSVSVFVSFVLVVFFVCLLFFLFFWRV